jgi:hypothetical protein
MPTYKGEMMIKLFIQGENNKELFGLIGEIVTSKILHKELGMAITSEHNDLWYLNIKKDKCEGFALARLTKSTNAIHVRFLSGSKSIKNDLLKRIIKDSKDKNLKSIWTNDRETETIWEENDFNKKPQSRGTFCRWEKDL